MIVNIVSKRGTLIVVAAACAAAPAAARGGLFASYSYDHSIFAQQSSTALPRSMASEVSGSTLPLQQTQTVSVPGATVSATYSIFDNGTTATYHVDCQAQITHLYCNAGEGQTSPPPDTFVLSEPATYVATFTDTGSGGTLVQFLTTDVDATDPGFSGSGTMTSTGMFRAGFPVSIVEAWGIANSSPTDPPTISGIESLSIVFTAVPEPASAGLAAAAAGAALLSRRRSRRVCR